MVSNLGPPDVLRLQLPEAFTATSAGQDFWELKFKNIWRDKVGDHWPRCTGGLDENQWTTAESHQDKGTVDK